VRGCALLFLVLSKLLGKAGIRDDGAFPTRRKGRVVQKSKETEEGSAPKERKESHWNLLNERKQTQTADHLKKSVGGREREIDG
jgi:hypothetical protein